MYVSLLILILFLPGWHSWLECCPRHQKVVGLFPGQGTSMRQLTGALSLSLSLSPLPHLPQVRIKIF